MADGAGAVRSYSTSAVADDAKHEYWQSVLAKHVPITSFAPLDRNFRSSLSVADIGSVGLALLSTDAGRLQTLGSAHARHGNDGVFRFVIPTRGSVVFEQDGRESVLCEGDQILCASGTPFGMTFHQPVEQMIISVPASVLCAHFPTAKQAVGLAVPAGSQLASAAVMLVRNVWLEIEKGLPQVYGRVLSGALLDMCAAVYAIRFEHVTMSASPGNERMNQVREFIDANLRDPGLRPETVAKALNLSTRYVCMLFAQRGTTLSTYLMQRRLDECARRIASPLWRSRTITKIAFDSGFNNAAHFTRVFKMRFKMTPRDYRRARVLA